ncbi:hypothetical protein SAMN06265222_101724 [Neorhodopirellula lusitana]|uniref:FecR protein n=1 Tax=Neorhodopirellula lusitana TaxID=445327 RepID=A0ABY1PQT0_9BACT|nr:hypothetical protein [Neorhodopirellula lusitana]SMP42162.1 hypothetical protein SAMN06265222_101724 [Neorhodopirellula lusitana]
MMKSNERARLMELIGLLRDSKHDGGLDDLQAAELESILESDAEALQYYVKSMDVIAMLHRQQGQFIHEQVEEPSEAAIVGLAKSTNVRPVSRDRRSVAGLGLAVCASLAIGVLAGQLFVPQNYESLPEVTRIAFSDSTSEIATLCSASGCRWDALSESRFEGQRLAPGPLRLIEGVAVIHFDSDVNLVLEGPAYLELANVDGAVLHHGKAVFSGTNDFEQFTLETPFSKFQDEGTEYAVIVDPQNEFEEIHVFDGRVMRDANDTGGTTSQIHALKLDAGEARRFGKLDSIESIRLDSSRFIRNAVVPDDATELVTVAESFAYDRDSLAGLDGGTGWQSPWTQPARYDADQGAKVQTNSPLSWPGRDEDDGSGSLLVEGNTGVHRALQNPIRMNRDGAYYMSFLVRKAPSEKGWVCITLRNLEDKKGSISFGLRGKARVVHGGRSTEGTSKLPGDSVHLLVCKILARKDKADQVTLRVYGEHEIVDTVEPSAWSITARPIFDSSVLRELRLYSKNSSRVELDDIRIGKTWASVTSF